MNDDDITAALKPLSTPQELADFLGKTVASLANDRYMGTGIPFVRIGRSIRYERPAIAAYIAANRHTRSNAEDEE